MLVKRELLCRPVRRVRAAQRVQLICNRATQHTAGSAKPNNASHLVIDVSTEGYCINTHGPCHCTTRGPLRV
eukprot:255513-Rhodomonas_salina.4